MSVGVDDERREIVWPVMRPRPRTAIIHAAVLQCGAVKRRDRLPAGSRECQMKSRSRGALPPRAKLDCELVATARRTITYRLIQIALHQILPDTDITERRESRVVKRSRTAHVRHAKRNMMEHVGHLARVTALAHQRLKLRIRLQHDAHMHIEVAMAAGLQWQAASLQTQGLVRA